jgi:hypothetical protein
VVPKIANTLLRFRDMIPTTPSTKAMINNAMLPSITKPKMIASMELSLTPSGLADAKMTASTMLAKMLRHPKMLTTNEAMPKPDCGLLIT